MRAGVLTVSDRAWRGEYKDESGPALVACLREWAHDVNVVSKIVADEQPAISDALKQWCDELSLALVITTGGTGLSARDVTPEATRAVIDREIVGIAELMRAEGCRVTPMAALSRQVVGQRGKTLIINVPGSVKGASESFIAVQPILAHAIKIINS